MVVTVQPFVITSDLESLRSGDVRLVEVPTDLQDKQALLAWYTSVLQLPEYFGGNWDAFDECLRDLSWIPERRLVIFHRNIPLHSNPKDQQIYIDVLARAAQDWKTDEPHEVVVAFDSACELPLRAIAKASGGPL